MSSTTRPANPRGLNQEQIREEAQAWYQRQIAVLEKVHGRYWPAHKAWLEDYLKEELRERLIACGWRPKQR